MNLVLVRVFLPTAVSNSTILEHRTYQHLALFAGRPFPTVVQVQQGTSRPVDGRDRDAVEQPELLYQSIDFMPVLVLFAFVQATLRFVNRKVIQLTIEN